LLGGWVSDQIVRGRFGRREWGRRGVGAFGQSLAALAFLASLRVDNHLALGALLCLTFFGNDLSMAPAWAAATDIGEKHAGALSGAMNMLASFCAGVGAMAAGALFDAGLPNIPIYLNSAAYATGALCWVLVDTNQKLADAE
jgi:predicted MFS family arabinose efflux permease